MIKPPAVYRNGNKISSGFTLAELMVASAILIVTIAGILISYLKSIELAEVSRNSSLAIQGARGRIEQIKSTGFNMINGTYDQATFVITDLDGMGVSYVNAINPKYLEVTVAVSWRQKSGRIYGEDQDLDGAIDAGEDTNANGQLDSPAEVVSRVFER